MRAAVGCAALGVATFFGERVSADSAPNAPELSFVWTAPEVCPPRETVLLRTERLLGKDIASSLTASVAIDARVDSTGAESFVLSVTSGAAGPPARRITARSCDELADATALLTALSIDPTLPLEAPPSVAAFESSAEPTTPAPAEQTKDAPPPAEIPQASALVDAGPAPTGRSAAAPRPSAHVGAAFSIWTGRLPGAAPGVDLEGGVALSRLGFLGELGFFPKRHAEGTGGTGGDLWMATAAARVTYELYAGAPRVVPTAGVSLAWLHGVGTDVENEASGDAAVVGLEPGLRVAYPVSRSVSLFAEGLLSIALNQPRFVVDGIGEVHEPGRFAGRFGAGFSWAPP